MASDEEGHHGVAGIVGPYDRGSRGFGGDSRRRDRCDDSEVFAKEIQVGVRQYERSRYGEVRMWYWTSEGGERKPSPKGVTFKLDLVETLLEALRTAEDQLKAGKVQ